MIFIGNYDELSPGQGFPLMKDNFYYGDYPKKDKIINYLRNGNIDMVSARTPEDVFTGEIINGYMLGMNDGVYMWWNTLAYYVDKYDLRLPPDFEKHILTM